MLKIKTIRHINAHGGALPAGIVGAVSWRSRTAGSLRQLSGNVEQSQLEYYTQSSIQM